MRGVLLECTLLSRLKINKSLEIPVVQARCRLLRRRFHFISESNSKSETVHYVWMGFWKIQALDIQFTDKWGTNSRNLGPMSLLLVEKFKVGYMWFYGEKLITLDKLVHGLSAPNSPFSVCSRNSRTFVLYSKDNVKFVSAEGAGGIGKGEGSFSSFLCAVFCFICFWYKVHRSVRGHPWCPDYVVLSDLIASVWAHRPPCYSPVSVTLTAAASSPLCEDSTSITCLYPGRLFPACLDQLWPGNAEAAMWLFLTALTLSMEERVSTYKLSSLGYSVLVLGHALAAFFHHRFNNYLD